MGETVLLHPTASSDPTLLILLIVLLGMVAASWR